MNEDHEMNGAVTSPATNNNRNVHIQRAIQIMIQRGEEKRNDSLILLTRQLQQQQQSNVLLQMYLSNSTDTTENANAIRIVFTVLCCLLTNGASIDFLSLNIASDEQLLQLMTQVNPRHLTTECYDKLNAYFNVHFHPELFPSDVETMRETEFVRYGGVLGHFLFNYVDSTFTILKGLRLAAEQ